MKKILSTILVVAILLSMTISAYATEVSDHLLEEMSVPEAMSNAEIVNFLISTGEIDELYQAQEEFVIASTKRLQHMHEKRSDLTVFPLWKLIHLLKSTTYSYL